MHSAETAESKRVGFEGWAWQLLERGWATLANSYERLERTDRGYVWLSKLGPAYLFGLVAIFKLLGAWQAASDLAQLGAGIERALVTAHHLTGFVFFGLVATLYLFRKRPIKRVPGPFQGLAALAGSYILLPVAIAGRVTDDVTVLFASTLLLVIGTGGAALALASLGRCFGIFPEARGLVTHGLYRFVRHPMYLFEFVAFLGVLLPALTPINALLYLAFTGLQLSRMVFEERTLEAAFPHEYPSYRLRTARLIPGLY